MPWIRLLTNWLWVNQRRKSLDEPCLIRQIMERSWDLWEGTMEGTMWQGPGSNSQRLSVVMSWQLERHRVFGPSAPRKLILSNNLGEFGSGSFPRGAPRWGRSQLTLWISGLWGPEQRASSNMLDSFTHRNHTVINLCHVQLLRLGSCITQQ